MISIRKGSKNSLALKCNDRILCSYINRTSLLQIIRITNIPSFYLERVVFPGQRLLFEAFTEAKLEIHTSNNFAAIITDIISCQKLSVAEK